MPNVGPLEIAIVLVIVLLIFGPKRLPGLGKQLGTGLREFKDSISGMSARDDERPEPEPAPAPELAAAPEPAAAEAPPAADAPPAAEAAPAARAEDRVSG